MTGDALRRGALAALRSGRVRIKFVRCDPALAPLQVVAQVFSSRPDGPRYAVDLDNGRWSCTCREGMQCKHIIAVRLVTIGVVA